MLSLPHNERNEEGDPWTIVLETDADCSLVKFKNS